MEQAQIVIQAQKHEQLGHTDLSNGRNRVNKYRRLTTELYIISRYKFPEVIGKHGLKRRPMLEEIPSWRKEHLVRVPCCPSIEEGVPSIERSSQSGVIFWEVFDERIEYIVR